MMISPLLFRITSLRKRSIISSRNFTDGLSAFYKERFVLTSEVKRCLQNKNPVVALESTIITHGMPFPQNLRTIQSVEKIIRENDATPAIIAVLNGKIHIGLEDNDLQNLAAKEFPVTKVSRRDLPVILAKKMNGGTTVSATMLIAHRIGIPVFVTGGIGGVHRGAEFSFDISADLTELGRTPITVISSGVKSILDINKTLEYLETQGVTVVSFGNSKEFPSFFTSKSGFFSPYNVKTPIQAAEIMAASNDMKLENGILIAVPIPEKDSANGKLVEDAILQSLEKSKQENINGKDVTPYILQQVNELTKGKSLEANIALIENNAKIGSQIAVEYAKLRNLQKNSTFPSNVHSIRKEENDEIQTHNQPSISST